MYAVSYTAAETAELVWLERPTLDEARVTALHQAALGDRKDIRVWQALEQIVPTLAPIPSAAE